MEQNKTKTELIVNRLPQVGIFVFGILYLYSSTLYPGGSQANIDAVGFDWVHNYWCNLMNEKGMNGVLNPARPFAIAAMIILCGSLMLFFIQFAEFYSESQVWKIIITTGGVLSMIFAMLIFTKYHDLMTIVSSFFGLFVVIGIIKEIYGSNLQSYKFSGVFCLLLLAANNFIYYSNQFIEWLPLLQKITFFIVLLWVLGLNYELRRKIKKELKA